MTFPGPAREEDSQTCSERNVVLRVSKDEPEAAATADLSAETGDPEGVRWAIPAAPTAATVAVPNATGIPRLGELLIESQLIASTQLDEALLQQSASGKRLGELLVELGAIDDFDLARVLATRLNLPLADLRQSTPEDDAIALVPEAMARANVAIPVRRTDEGLQIAMAFPQDAAAVDQMRGSAGLAVVPMIAPPSDIRRAIDKSYRALAGVSRHVDAFLAAEAITARTVTESDAGIDAPVVQVVNLIITQGVRDRASDIHIEPQDARVRVRYRIDGALHDVLALPANMGASVVSRIKVLAGMDIVERRKPQDGQIAMEVDGRPLDIRVATTATIWGEKSVMRLLDKNRSLFRLGDLGMPDETHDRVLAIDPRPVRHGDLRRPDRQRQDHDALRRAHRDQRQRAQHHDGRGPGRVRPARRSTRSRSTTRPASRSPAG